MKKIAFLIIALTALSAAAKAQDNSDALAIAGGRTFTAQDLDPRIAAVWTGLPKRIADARKALLDQQIEQRVLELEAEKRGQTIDEMIESEVSSKVPDPPEAEIQKVYNDNKAEIGSVPFDEIKPQIATYLKRNSEKDAYAKFIDSVKAVYKIDKGKDINSKDLKLSDTVATVDSKPILYTEYVKRNGLVLYELEANATDEVLNALTQVVDAAVYTSEAESLGMLPSELIAKEVTDKLKDFSDVERERLEGALKKRLYSKYKVVFFIKEPEPYVQQVSADDDPFEGKKDAPVTVVMFTDFQCPACSGVEPVLKRVIAEFGDKVRLVVRDFPLTSVHEHAFAAAVAANAARKQGKFFEYSELLYNNQDALDDASLKQYAAEAGLNVSRFEKDLRDPDIAAEIRKDIEDGKSYGVTGTPGIFVNGYRIRTLSESSFRKAIKRAAGMQ